MKYSNGWLMLALSDGNLLFRHIESSKLRKLQLHGPLSAVELHPRIPGIIAAGGKENDVCLYSCNPTCKSNIDELELWRTENVVKVFQGKNVKNDSLNLRVRVWITGIVFTEDIINVIDGKSEDDESLCFHFATITHYGQVSS